MSNKRGGLLFGVIMGTLLGVLFAPRKGKDLRDQLKTEVGKGGLGTDTLKKSFIEMGKDMADTAEEVYQTPEVQKHVAKGKKKLNKFIKDTTKQVNQAESKIKQAGEKYIEMGQGKLDEAMYHVEGGINMVKKRIIPGNKIEKTEIPNKPNSKPKGKKRTKKINVKKTKS